MSRTYNYSNGGSKTIYEKHELPRNAIRFMKEVESNDYTFGDISYEVLSSPQYSLVHDNPPDTETEINIDVYVDAEHASKTFPANKNIGRELDEKYDSLARVLGIDRVWFFPKYINKQEFADKFLKKLKAHLKTTESGPFIHSIRFDVSNPNELEITIVKKRISWGRGYAASDRVVKDTVNYYLNSIGYPNIKIHIP
jgi:hypothetical protein